MLTLRPALLLFLLTWGGAAAAAEPRLEEFRPRLERVLQETVAPLARDPAVVTAIRRQNEAHAGLSDTAVLDLDKRWRAEVQAGSGALVRSLLEAPVSKLLKERQAGSLGLIAEAFVMDARGLNVGQTNITSDYFQADEAKWQKTYAAGPAATLIDAIAFDESAGTYVSQVSMCIVDPDTGRPIGAITVAVDLAKI
ncbi:MAG TPA: hypothetical protein VEB20_08800 [Azospirillaceae bacterium]|nr:hypothetical protein [Azospirillaceae bacterium]